MSFDGVVDPSDRFNPISDRFFNPMARGMYVWQ